MCIICNLTDPHEQIYVASDFLHDFKAAQQAMAKAAESMLAVSKLELKPEDKRRYDKAHKQMKRVIRDWNMIEHTRESTATAL